MAIEDHQPVNMEIHFPPFVHWPRPSTKTFNLKLTEMYHYLEDSHLPTNVKCQQSIIAEAKNDLLFNALMFHFTVKSSKTVEHKLALCITLELSGSIFELYHSGLLISHQGLTRTYYKLRKDFFIRNVYKYIFTKNYIMVIHISWAAGLVLLIVTYLSTRNSEAGQARSSMTLIL